MRSGLMEWIKLNLVLNFFPSLTPQGRANYTLNQFKHDQVYFGPVAQNVVDVFKVHHPGTNTQSRRHMPTLKIEFDPKFQL